MVRDKKMEAEMLERELRIKRCALCGWQSHEFATHICMVYTYGGFTNDRYEKYWKGNKEKSRK